MPDQSYAATEHALLEEITGPLQRLAEDPLELAPADFPTAMRGYDRVLRLAWTLSDLDGTSRPDADHVGRALYLRKAAR